MDDFCRKEQNSKFNVMLKQVFKEFEELCEKYKIERVNTEVKQRGLSLFAKEKEKKSGAKIILLII